MDLNWVLAKIVMSVHFVLVVWIFLLPWISYSRRWLLLSIVLNVVLLTIWYLFGTCPLNYIENYLLGNKKTDQNGQAKNNFIYVLSPLFGKYGDKVMYYLFSIVPLTNVIVACCKLRPVKSK